MDDTYFSKNSLKISVSVLCRVVPASPASSRASSFLFPCPSWRFCQPLPSPPALSNPKGALLYLVWCQLPCPGFPFPTSMVFSKGLPSATRYCLSRKGLVPGPWQSGVVSGMFTTSQKKRVVSYGLSRDVLAGFLGPWLHRALF